MNTTRVAEVRKTLDTCIRAARDGDAALPGSLFHRRAVVAGDVDGALAIRSPDLFIERAATLPAGADHRACVTEITLVGETATLIEEAVYEGQNTLNRLRLVRNPGGARVITARRCHRDDTPNRDQGS